MNLYAQNGGHRRFPKARGLTSRANASFNRGVPEGSGAERK